MSGEMPVFVLERFAYCPVGTGMGVFGEMRCPELGFVCFTVERPWDDNLPGLSCIPEGTYTMVRDFFHAGGYPAFEIVDVPGRAEIKIHVANAAHQLKGCIAPGESLGCVGGFWAVKRSQPAFDRFMGKLVGIDRAGLVICSLFPAPQVSTFDPTLPPTHST